MSEELFLLLELTLGLGRGVKGNDRSVQLIFGKSFSVVLKMRNPRDVDTMST